MTSFARARLILGGLVLVTAIQGLDAQAPPAQGPGGPPPGRQGGGRPDVPPLHGVTSEVTWNVVATFGNDMVAGRATTTFGFAAFKMTKPTLARLMSVDDKIELEIEFKASSAL